MSKDEKEVDKPAGLPSLHDRVASWLAGEGYPLEFWTAAEYRRHGFNVEQGHYTTAREGDSPREVDVWAAVDIAEREPQALIVDIVECKYTEKPWVVLTSADCRWPNEYTASQALSNEYARNVFDKRRADFKDCAIFNAPPRGGFSGRQAFADNRDIVYATLQSVVEKAAAVAKSLALKKKDKDLLLCAAFPVVVIDGRLFEAHYVVGIQLAEVPSARVYWRGSAASGLAVVDIVTKGHLPAFLIERHRDLTRLADCLIDAALALQLRETQDRTEIMRLLSQTKPFSE